MVWDLKPKRLSYDDIRKIAGEFLRQYHPSGSIPVPIEEIVEINFGIDIVPIPNLQQTWDIVGFTSFDQSQITVDQFVFEVRENRYRFTLAHEMGHITMHPELFEASRFNNTKAYKEFISSIPAGHYEWYEWQANSFAGLVLVPRDELNHEFKNILGTINSMRALSRISREFIWDTMVSKLASVF